MAIIRYKKTHFTAPDKISEPTYHHYKKLLSEDPDFKLTDDPQHFTSRFKRNLKHLSWTLPLCLLLSLAFAYFFPIPATEPEPIRITLFIIILIVGVIALAMLLQLLLEGPSYATYLKTRDAYFHHMKVAISKSPDYPNFYHGFYSGGSRSSSSPGAKQTLSVDSFLTNLFYIIDKYWWIVFLLGAVVFFGRKMFFKD